MKLGLFTRLVSLFTGEVKVRLKLHPLETAFQKLYAEDSLVMDISGMPFIKIEVLSIHEGCVTLAISRPEGAVGKVVDIPAEIIEVRKRGE